MILIVGTGCNNDTSSVITGEGYILEVSESGILVIDNKYLNQTWNDIIDEYQGKAIWLTTNTDQLKPGQKVQYKIEGGVDESYPEQAKAEEIRIIED